MNPLSRFTVLVVCAVTATACRSAPTPEPLPQPPSPPVAVPESAPPPPVGHAPLVGPDWIITTAFGDRDVARPAPGEVTLTVVRTHDGDILTLEVAGHQVRVPVRIRVVPEDPSNPVREEGALQPGSAQIELQDGRSYRAYVALLADNIDLAQGYVIVGERPTDSRLTIFGGYGMEEIVLAQFRVDPATVPVEAVP